MKLMLLLSLFFAFSTEAETLLGIARNLEGEVLYKEHHEIQFDKQGYAQKIEVQYQNLNDEVFATMTSEFSKNQFIPDTIFVDHRFGKKEKMFIENNHVVFQTFEGQKLVSKSSTLLKENMVASQGFDNFIKRNRLKLKDTSVKFKFGVLSRKNFYTLVGYKKKSKSPTQEKFGIKANSWLLRIFASEIEVSYDKKNFKLLHFSGQSNLTDDQGNSQYVVIEYKWKAEAS